MTPAELRAFMEREGWTVQDLAAELGVSHRQMTRWRSGEAPIRRVVELALRSLSREKDLTSFGDHAEAVA